MKSYKTEDNPLITVLMPVYNANKFIKQAIESILHQTYTNFEFLIIDDGSIDNSMLIIQEYDDPRIKTISNKRNIGVGPSLNEGVLLAKGKYIARMDADDISKPKRLATQVAFLETHPTVSLVGSWAKVINVNNEIIKIYIMPLHHDAIMAKMVLDIGLIHPSIMFRRADFLNLSLNYDLNCTSPGQDKELWLRAGKLLIFRNLPSFLVCYRYTDINYSKAGSELVKFYNFSNWIKKYYHARQLTFDYPSLLSKFFSPPIYLKVIKPTKHDFEKLLFLVSDKHFNKFERAYFCYVLFKLAKIDKKYLKNLSLKNRMLIYYLVLKWIFYQF